MIVAKGLYNVLSTDYWTYWYQVQLGITSKTARSTGTVLYSYPKCSHVQSALIASVGTTLTFQCYIIILVYITEAYNYIHEAESCVSPIIDNSLPVYTWLKAAGSLGEGCAPPRNHRRDGARRVQQLHLFTTVPQSSRT